MRDSPELADSPDEQPLQFELREDGDGLQRPIDHSGDVAAMAWCDARLPATAANIAAATVGVCLTWSLLYVNVSSELMTVPGGSLSSIFMLYVTGTVAGKLIYEIVGLPLRFGMLLAGIALQNTGLYTVTGWCSQLVSFIRWKNYFILIIVKNYFKKHFKHFKRQVFQTFSNTYWLVGLINWKINTSYITKYKCKINKYLQNE